MPKYMITVKYNANGVKALIKDGGSARRAAVSRAAEGIGGRVESFYFAFGETDAYVIVDVPDNVSAAALSLAVNASGAVSINAAPLLTCEDVDAAARKTVDYKAPGA